jgi:hypothetical protein
VESRIPNVRRELPIGSEWMERYIGIGRTRRELHAGGDFRERPKALRDFPVETNGQALVEAVRMIPGHKHLVFEEGLQSA